MELQQPKPKKKMKTWLKVLIIIVTVDIVLIAAAAGALVYYYYSRVNYQPLGSTAAAVETPDPAFLASLPGEVDLERITPTPSPTPVPTPTPTPDPETVLYDSLAPDAEQIPENDGTFSIMLIGTDERKEDASDGCRSDTMMLVTVNPSLKRIVLTSFMRDSYVKIPGYNKTRLNAAYSHGGAELLLRTMNEYFGIPVDLYAHVNFYSFIDAVDALGGVTMHVSKTMLKQMNKVMTGINDFLGENVHADQLDTSLADTDILLNGKQALAYARVRHGDGQGDITRTLRQRELLTAVIDQHRDLNLIELYALSEAVLPNVTTNLTAGEVVSLLLNAKEYLHYDIVSARVPEKISYLMINGASMVKCDAKEGYSTWYNAVYGEIETEETTSDSEDGTDAEGDAAEDETPAETAEPTEAPAA